MKHVVISIKDGMGAEVCHKSPGVQVTIVDFEKDINPIIRLNEAMYDAGSADKAGEKKVLAKQDVWIWHKGIGIDKHGNNITLCGLPGATSSPNRHITCNKCRSKLHMKKIPTKTDGQ